MRSDEFIELLAARHSRCMCNTVEGVNCRIQVPASTLSDIAEQALSLSSASANPLPRICQLPTRHDTRHVPFWHAGTRHSWLALLQRQSCTKMCTYIFPLDIRCGQLTEFLLTRTTHPANRGQAVSGLGVPTSYYPPTMGVPAALPPVGAMTCSAPT